MEAGLGPRPLLCECAALRAALLQQQEPKRAVFEQRVGGLPSSKSALECFGPAATAARPSMTSALDAFLIGVDNILLGSPTPPPAAPDSPRRSTTVERRGQLRRHLQDLLHLRDPQEDFDALCERCFQSGIPDDSGLRPVLWRLLLGYLPRDRTAWAPTLLKKRAEYAELRARFITPEIDEYMRQPREIIFRCDR